MARGSTDAVIPANSDSFATRLICGALPERRSRNRTVILLQEAHEFIPIEPPPTRVQAGEEFEFAAREE